MMLYIIAITIAILVGSLLMFSASGLLKIRNKGPELMIKTPDPKVKEKNSIISLPLLYTIIILAIVFFVSVLQLIATNKPGMLLATLGVTAYLVAFFAVSYILFNPNSVKSASMYFAAAPYPRLVYFTFKNKMHNIIYKIIIIFFAIVIFALTLLARKYY